MANRLAHENSPYLLQHSENPVDWYPWGEEAFTKARREDKPIFLSIGYAACHWCHVMAHESFEDPEIAKLMNQSFVNIKVDREERPDLDSIYMSAVVAITGQGGWPMSVFLTPDGIPFFGGTYFPAQPRYGMPAFKQVLEAIERSWLTDRQRLQEASLDLFHQIQQSNAIELSGSQISKNSLEEAAMRLVQTYDWESSGWGKAPKFPQPMAIEFLLRRASRGDKLALDVAINVLNAMARGGFYDVVGGGFARYSTDNEWLVPHFEKMLYDNAQLARVYLHAYLLTNRDFYKRICVDTLDFIHRDLNATPGNKPVIGGFSSSLDADSEGEEGRYYVWDRAELEQILSEDLSFFGDAFGIPSAGNFEGKIILQRTSKDVVLAEKYELSENQVSEQLRKMLQKLNERRKQRIRPGTDDKVLTAWNALALIAFAEAARYLKRNNYLKIAQENASFLLDELIVNGRLLRSWRNGKAQHNAYLEDYASLILGLLTLYQSDPNPFWYAAAEKLANEMAGSFDDPNGGFFDTRVDQEGLIIRPKDLQDNATPSGNSSAAIALLQLSIYSGNDEYREKAEKIISKISPLASRYPTAFAQWLTAADFTLADTKEVAILGDPSATDTVKLVNKLWATYRPDIIAAISDFPPPPEAPALLKDRSMINDRPTAYVCRRFVCLHPVTTPGELSDQLAG